MSITARKVPKYEATRVMILPTVYFKFHHAVFNDGLPNTKDNESMM